MDRFSAVASCNIVLCAALMLCSCEEKLPMGSTFDEIEIYKPGENPDKPVVPDTPPGTEVNVNEPDPVTDVRPERGALTTYTKSKIKKKYWPVNVQVGGTTPGSYNTMQARLIYNMEGYDFKEMTRKEFASNHDKYGGDRTLPAQTATGRFYVKKVGNRFWFVDPEGYLCYLRGVASLTNEGATSPRNRAAMASKYGNDLQKWLADVREEFSKCGVTAACAFLKDDSAIRTYNKNHPDAPIPFAPSLNFLSSFKKAYYPSASNEVALALKPEWASWCESYVAEKLAPYKGDRNVLGFFSDNEITFTGGESAAEAYFKGIKQAVQKYDPSMLYFGSRLHGSAKNNSGILTAAGKWCDAVAVNYYGDWSPDINGMLSNWTTYAPNTPFFITEFYTKGCDVGLSNKGGAGMCVPDQYTRAYAYQHFTLGLLEDPHIVGWVWFRYQDDPENAAEASNKGLFDNDYNVYPFLGMYMRNINYNVHSLIEYFDGTI